MRISYRHDCPEAVEPPGIAQILLNIFEVNLFEKIAIDQLVTDALLNVDDFPVDNQLNLF